MCDNHGAIYSTINTDTAYIAVEENHNSKKKLFNLSFNNKSFTATFVRTIKL